MWDGTSNQVAVSPKAGPSLKRGCHRGVRLSFGLGVPDGPEPPAGSTVATSYYFHAGRRVAMRADNTVYYLYGDCRGSAPHALPFR